MPHPYKRNRRDPVVKKPAKVPPVGSDAGKTFVADVIAKSPGPAHRAGARGDPHCNDRGGCPSPVGWPIDAREEFADMSKRGGVLSVHRPGAVARPCEISAASLAGPVAKRVRMASRFVCCISRTALWSASHGLIPRSRTPTSAFCRYVRTELDTSSRATTPIRHRCHFPHCPH